MAQPDRASTDTANTQTPLVEHAAVSSHAIVAAALNPETAHQVRLEIEECLTFQRAASESVSLHLHDLLGFLTLAHASSLIAQKHRNDAVLADAGGQPDPDGWECNTQALIGKALESLGLVSVAQDEPAKGRLH